MADFTYAEARSAVMQSMNVVMDLIEEERQRGRRRELLDLFTSLQRELAKLDSIDLLAQKEKYRALTLRFGSSSSALNQAREQAKELSDKLNLTASAIGALGTLAGAL